MVTIHNDNVYMNCNVSKDLSDYAEALDTHPKVLFYAPAIFSGGGGAGGAHIVSPLSVQMVSVQYLLKRLVYWIDILYTGI